jgi:rhamnose transport system permease protein
MNARALLTRVARAREIGLLVALVLLFVVTTAVTPSFVHAQSLKDLLLNTSIIALLAVGQTLVVLTRNIDLSVGSVLGLSAFCTGLFFSDGHTSIPVAIGLGVLIGAACGVVNGVLVAICKIPALVVTLGTLYVFRGLDYAIANGRQITASQVPSAFLNLGSGSVLGIPILVLVALVMLAITAWGLRNLRIGRELYAIGSNPEAAVLAGLRVNRRLFGAFVLTGALSGLAGVLQAARFGTVDASFGSGLELNVVAAVVVGGVAIFGGSGSAVGAALGALLLSTIGSALVVLKVDSLWEQAIDGALLLAAIALDRLLALRTARALKASASRGATLAVPTAPPPEDPPTVAQPAPDADVPDADVPDADVPDADVTEGSTLR